MNKYDRIKFIMKNIQDLNKEQVHDVFKTVLFSKTENLLNSFDISEDEKHISLCNKKIDEIINLMKLEFEYLQSIDCEDDTITRVIMKYNNKITKLKEKIEKIKEKMKEKEERLKYENLEARVILAVPNDQLEDLLKIYNNELDQWFNIASLIIINNNIIKNRKGDELQPEDAKSIIKSYKLNKYSVVSRTFKGLVALDIIKKYNNKPIPDSDFEALIKHKDKMIKAQEDIFDASKSLDKVLALECVPIMFY